MKLIRTKFSCCFASAWAKFCLGGVMLLLFASASQAQDQGTREKHYNLDKDLLALQGYDPVAYLEDSKATKGSATYIKVYKGVTYRFATEHHRSIFEKNPERFEPAYGGWCAYAMAHGGEKVKINPKAFKVIDDKTYLFYKSRIFGDTLEKWNEAPDAEQLTAAQAGWNKQLVK